MLARAPVVALGSIDPDDVRDAACEATATGEICRALEPRDFDTTDLPNAPGAAGGGGVLGLLLVAVLVIMILIAVAWLARTWLEGRTTGDDDADDQGELDDDIDGEVEARIIDRETPPERWRRLAAEHREAGRFREAIRCSYRALVGDLARAGFVDEIPGRTSGEEREQIAALAPSMSSDFDIAADLFDEAWFNDDEVTAEHDARFSRASSSVSGVVGSR